MVLPKRRLPWTLRGCDPQTCGELISSYGGKLYSLFFQLSGSHHVSEDLVQEAFLRIWRSLSGFRTQSSISTWIYRIAVNTFYDHIRAEKRRPAVVAACSEPADCKSDNAPPSVQAVQNEELHRLADAVQHLPAELRLPLVLRYYHGLSVRRTASASGISYSQTKYRLKRALDCLEHSLEPRIKILDSNCAEGVA